MLLDVEEAEQGIYEVAKKKIVKSMTPLCFTSLENFYSRKLHLRRTVILAELKGLLEQAHAEQGYIDMQTDYFISF